jgi:hypothetical protein
MSHILGWPLEYRVEKFFLTVVEIGIVKMVTQPAPTDLNSGAYIYEPPRPTMCTAGPFGYSHSKYMMLYTCYRSYMPFKDQDPMSIYVQRKGGWMSVNYDSVDYFLPSDYAVMLYLYDSRIERKPKLDYIV